MLAEIGHRVEVEIERLAGEQVFSGELRVPHGEQPRHLLRGDARGVFRQEALLGHSVEPAEQCQPLVGDQRHHVALAFNRPELEGQRGAESMRGPGSLAPCARASPSRRTRSGTNRNNPPTVVVNSRELRTKSPTLATAWALGPTRTGRSSSSRRGKGAKPSAAKTSRTAVALSGVPCFLSAWLIS